SSQKLYANGELKTSQALTGTISTNNLPLIIGDLFNGPIDEVRIYNRALSAEEISDLYNNYGYTTTNYPGRVLVRKYALPEPTYSIGEEEYNVVIPPEFSFVFKHGWNLISLSGMRITSIITDICNIFSKDFYYYNATTKKYIMLPWNQLEGGKGYFVYSPHISDCPVSLDVTGIVTIADIPPLIAGYNLIGTTSATPYNISSIKGTCDIIDGPYYWDEVVQSWVYTTTIVAGRGYWLKVSSNCNFS
ncbi:MAG: hypothetical protein QMD14_02595, partial [Candidatus Aenigmarchaeota archaeon]|nr:hypothetical protein [Candidatus Aenigmarchaeota archaeon]